MDVNNQHSQNAIVSWTTLDGKRESVEIPSGDRTMVSGNVRSNERPSNIKMFANGVDNGAVLYLNGKQYFEVEPSTEKSRVFVMLGAGIVLLCCMCLDDSISLGVSSISLKR